jgi:hypothetical protein
MPDIEEMTTNKAEEIAEQRYGREFNDLPSSLQMQVWMEAEQQVADDLATQAELRMDDMKIRQNGKGETKWDELELMRRLGK